MKLNFDAISSLNTPTPNYKALVVHMRTIRLIIMKELLLRYSLKLRARVMFTVIMSKMKAKKPTR